MHKHHFTWHERYENYVFVAVGVLLASLLRFSLLEFESGDFKSFLEPWYDFINQHGGFNALQYEFSNYTPLYLYFMVIASYLFSGFSKVLAVKLTSILFDFICAFFVYKIVRIKYPAGITPVFAFLATLFAPTVVLNSAFWGQADITYTTGLVACIYLLATNRKVLAFVAFGLAISVKLQAVFLLPFLLILLVKRNVSWHLFLLIPFVYIATIFPAWLIGRPFLALLLIYVAQADYYQVLAFNIPNMYQWFPNELYSLFYPAGLTWTLAVVFMLGLGVYKSRTKITTPVMIQLATISVLIMPYLLPKMHDRYFFAADVISIIFAFYFPQYFFVPVTIGMVSLFSYFPFLFGREVIPLALLAVILAVTIVILLYHLATILQQKTGYEDLEVESTGSNHNT